jgi:type I restriction enzyme R subunit
VDRNNLARQTESEFNLFDRTENQQNMGSLYQIKRLRNETDIKGDIVISTIQKLTKQQARITLDKMRKDKIIELRRNGRKSCYVLYGKWFELENKKLENKNLF